MPQNTLHVLKTEPVIYLSKMRAQNTGPHWRNRSSTTGKRACKCHSGVWTTADHRANHQRLKTPQTCSKCSSPSLKKCCPLHTAWLKSYFCSSRPAEPRKTDLDRERPGQAKRVQNNNNNPRRNTITKTTRGMTTFEQTTNGQRMHGLPTADTTAASNSGTPLQTIENKTKKRQLWK